MAKRGEDRIIEAHGAGQIAGSERDVTEHCDPFLALGYAWVIRFRWQRKTAGFAMSSARFLTDSANLAEPEKLFLRW
jgi:hypothetical protein